MSACSRCGAPMASDARFCASCGEAGAAVGGKATRTSVPTPRQVTDHGEHERFVPGTLVAERYRIVGLLGRGGMGEVYRADDLKLGQPVALKFLPRELADNPDRLQRLYNEVRLARKISHPNICRVYDVGETGSPGSGQVHPFLTMEYVDGEDLASLLLRIGRLPEDKAVQVARQVCAGLAAAHDQGVLHRDLKPANVMIDGRGRARVTDFGLAALADTVQEGDRSGTPVYMAPEQLAGSEVTIQSDLYALGLLLYEVFTGKRAFEGTSFEAALRERGSSLPTSPASLVSGLDPAIELAISSCLRPEAHERPPSALAVAAALPGGDPLAAALAAGETPSPELVAAAPTEGTLSGAVAWGGAGLTVLALVAMLVLRSMGWAPYTGKSPAALKDRALETLQSLGYQADHTMIEVDNQGAGDDPYRFWLRGGPRPLAPSGWDLRGGLDNPPPVEPGMTSLITDTQGRLYKFEAVPSRIDPEGVAGMAAAPDWTVAFAAAGLDYGNYAAAMPRLRPRHDVDRRFAWEARDPGAQRIEAGTRAGRIVWFEVGGEQATGYADRTAPSGRLAVFFVLLILFFLGILVAGAVLARRNLSSGRGDRRGALRLASGYLLLDVTANLCGMRHTVSFDEVLALVWGTGLSLFVAAGVWLLYIAIEPEIRNRWPHRIVSWTRMLDGRLADPLVGRDVLVGALTGLALAVLFSLPPILETWWRGTADVTGHHSIFQSALGLRGVVGTATGATAFGLMLALGLVVVWLGMFLVLRRESLAAGCFATVLILGRLIEDPTPFMGIVVALSFVILLTVMLRVGLLSLVAMMAVFHTWVMYPYTADLDVWYAGHNALMSVIAVAPAFFGAWAASRPASRRRVARP